MAASIGISLGDVTGIGPEVTLKALAAELPADDARYLLVGDEQNLRSLNECLGLGLGIGTDRIAVFNPVSKPLPATLAAGHASAAKAAMAWLEEAARRCLHKELDAMVTAPVNKEAIVRSGLDFVGQTEYLTGLDGNSETAMMLLGHDERGRWLRVALATTHVPIKRVAECLTGPAIERVIGLAARACGQLGLPRARVAVCGLNPHAGEGGKMGTEEQTIITPAVEAARARKLDVSGPFSADALFYYVLRGDYDAVVAMYHDQGLVPLKMIGFETGVNWTLGLSFIRTSPDHGTAYDIAGKGVANPSSMIAAIRLAKKLARNR
jgi:4-hydroxythreonine-4-phosphate dehydrogenase